MNEMMPLRIIIRHFFILEETSEKKFDDRKGVGFEMTSEDLSERYSSCSLIHVVHILDRWRKWEIEMLRAKVILTPNEIIT